jgi:outer membrane protein OmpA-like peptidoglycan-associated protein
MSTWGYFCNKVVTFIVMNTKFTYVYLLIFMLLPSLMVAQEGERKFSVYFENDIYELNTTHHQLLDSLKAIPVKDSLDVHIKGYTNSVGSETYNLELSRKRAENVKAALREFTIISSNGFGELNSEAANNRRVDVLIHFKKDHIAVEGEIREEPVKIKVAEPTLANLIAPKIGDKITLEGIRFYADRDIIMDESRDALTELVTFLVDNPSVKFKLIGHICCGNNDNPGHDLMNIRTGKKNLSEARARALHNFLAKKGIDTKRMNYIGMAFRKPTGKGDRFDRRVEIEITSVD